MIWFTLSPNHPPCSLHRSELSHCLEEFVAATELELLRLHIQITLTYELTPMRLLHQLAARCFFYRRLSILLIILISSLASVTTLKQAGAAIVTFSNQANFLAAAGPVLLESFETVGTQVASNSPLVAPVLTVIPPSAPLGGVAVRDNPGNGLFATDGSQYIALGTTGDVGGVTNYELDTPSTVVGFSVTDFGDKGVNDSGTLIFRTNTGEMQNIASSPLPDGNQLFFGAIADTPFSSFSVEASTSSDGYGVDEIYVNSIPEPSSLLLAGISGLLGMSYRRRKRA